MRDVNDLTGRSFYNPFMRQRAAEGLEGNFLSELGVSKENRRTSTNGDLTGPYWSGAERRKQAE
jgi:hypothetical protein